MGRMKKRRRQARRAAGALSPAEALALIARARQLIDEHRRMRGLLLRLGAVASIDRLAPLLLDARTLAQQVRP